MDWVQIYATVLLGIELLAVGVKCGEAKSGKPFLVFLFGAAVTFPIYGRVFGLW